LWIGVALGFYGWLRGARGVDEANLFLAGYTLEKTLSVDNLVVFIAIFEYFRIKGALQSRVQLLKSSSRPDGFAMISSLPLQARENSEKQSLLCEYLEWLDGRTST
jgi:hypothetical protein